jgi:hypothetical protein
MEIRPMGRFDRAHRELPRARGRTERSTPVAGTQDTNCAAIAFYQELGFSVVGFDRSL